MDFGLSPEQQMLRDAVDRLLREHCPLDHVRKVAAGGNNVSAAVVAAMAELGLPGIVVPEEHGGLGLGLLDAAVVAEALGAAVAPAPFMASAVLAPLALRLAGSPAQQAHWLPRIADGSARVGVGLTEAVNRRDGGGVEAGGGTLRGTALFVLDSADADAFIIADQRGRMHLVAGDAERLERVSLSTIDLTRSVGELRLDGVAAEPLGDDDGGTARRLVAAGRVLLAADSVGAGDAMIAQAVGYAGEREQFGRVIGSFQAVKHMCAEMAARLEPCRSLVWYAAHAFDAVPDEALLMACHAKSHTGEAGRFVARTATEVHGGMGFTDLLGLHYWFKRIGFDRQVLGGPEIVRAEAAALQGWGKRAAGNREQQA
jgi:alkylation response protein AidB-like acyl-CoA dehydrogenase